MTNSELPQQASVPAPKPKLFDRLKALAAELGPLAFVVWYIIFGLTWLGFIVAIRAGYQPKSGSGEAGLIFAAYAAARLTFPIRIWVTLALTPLVASAWRALKKKWRRT